MVDYAWPAGLAPYKVMFYLQPHVGGSESPLTRVRKVYGLSAPRWIARLSFRAGYDGVPRYENKQLDQTGFGPLLDALIVDLEGGLNRVRLHDFRRPHLLQPPQLVRDLTARATAKGATEMTITGFRPGGIAFTIGDYVGGDGRPHLIRGGAIVVGAGTILANAAGEATVSFRPPLSAPIAEGAPLRFPADGAFLLTSEDAGQNETEVGQPTDYTLDFVEDLS